MSSAQAAPLAVLFALAGAGCPRAVPGAAAGPASGIGRVCAEGVAPELLAAQAIAAAYRLLSVRDLQLVPTDTAGFLVAVYRTGPDEARPQDVFAATVAAQGACAAVIAQGEACDALADAPIYLPRFPEGSVAVGPAVREVWDAIDEPVVFVPLEAQARDAEPGFPEARARGTCAFLVGALADGRAVPVVAFSWVDQARTVEIGRDGNEYTTEATTTLEASGESVPRPLTVVSLVTDVACADTDDRQAACLEACEASRPLPAEGEEESGPDCPERCGDVAAEPGRWCTARLDSVTEEVEGTVEPGGRLTWETIAQDVTTSPLDADCVLAGRPVEECGGEARP